MEPDSISLADIEVPTKIRKKSVVALVEVPPPPPEPEPPTVIVPVEVPLPPKKKSGYRIIESDTSGPLNVGSIRMRLFKALAREGANPGDGLTHKEIQTTTQIPENSGSLGVIIIQEVKRGRLLVSISETAGGGTRRHTVRRYRLSAFGRRDFDQGKIDGNRHAGHRIGTPWTQVRHSVESQKEESDLSSL